MSALTVGVPRERAPGERRVALTPDVAGRLVAVGVDVVVEPGAGDGARLDDGAYVAAGARIGEAAWGCDVVVKVSAPTPVEIDRLRPGAVLIGLLGPRHDLLTARGVTAFALEAVPRISRAQTMDALTSQATIAGYKAVLVATEHLTRLLPMMTTAAGTRGNCELSEPGRVVTHHGVTVVTPLNLPAEVPEHASRLYARNVLALLELMLVDGRLSVDLSDEILAGACVSRGEAFAEAVT